MRPRRRSFDTAPVQLTVLVVGVSPTFLERFRLAAAPRRAEIVACDEASFRTTAAARVPRSIVILADAYARSSSTYDQVRDELCARVIPVEREDLQDEEIEALVDTAVRWL